jgi:hypothetical protein
MTIPPHLRGARPRKLGVPAAPKESLTGAEDVRRNKLTDESVDHSTQIFYRTFVEGLGTPTIPVPEWDSLPQAEKDRWRAAVRNFLELHV